MKKHIQRIRHFAQRVRHKTNWNIVETLHLNRFQKSAILAFAILAFLGVNLLASFISLRIDLSKGQAYTLSSSTRTLVAKLDKETVITLYTSDNIPARLQPIAREVTDLLREYERANRSVRVVIDRFNPNEDKDTVMKLQQAGIVGLPVREQQQGEVSVTQIYFGIIVTRGDKTETIAQALDVENLEYSLTSALYRMTNETLPVVSVMGATAGMFTQQDPLQVFKQIAGGLFDIQTVQPTTPVEEGSEEEQVVSIDKNTKTLIVIDDVNTTFTDADIAAIDAYLQSGNAIVLTDGVVVSDQDLATSSGEAKLHALLSKRGIKVNQDIVLSGQAELVNMGGGGFSLLVPYPAWVWATKFDDEVGYFSGIGRLTFAWTSSLESQKKEGIAVNNLVQSSEDSWVQSGTFSLNPQDIPDPNETDFKSLNVISESVANNGAKMMVIGNSRFINTQYLSRDSQNIEYLVNVLSDYASDGSLSGISRRSISLYPLPNLPKSLQETYKYSVILILPLLFVGYGAWRIVNRSKKSTT